MTLALDIGRPILVASHFRSGTHLLMDLLRRQFRACRPRLRPLESIHDSYLSLDRLNVGHHRPIDEAGARTILRKAPRPTLKSHAFPDFPQTDPAKRELLRSILADADRLYVVRDGRDVMCSMHAWTANFKAGGLRPFAQFLREPNNEGQTPPAFWASHVLAWLDAPGVRVIRFEDLVKRPDAVVAALEGVVGERARGVQPVLPAPIRTPLQAALARLTGNLESTNVHNGRYTPLKRAEAFDADAQAFFDAEAGGAMPRLAAWPAGAQGLGV